MALLSWSCCPGLFVIAIVIVVVISIVVSITFVVAVIIDRCCHRRLHSWCLLSPLWWRSNGGTAMGAAMAEKEVVQQWQWQCTKGNGSTAIAMVVQQRLWQRSNGDGNAALVMVVQQQLRRCSNSNGNGNDGVQQWGWQWWWRRSNGDAAMMEAAQQWWWTKPLWRTIELYCALFLSNKLISYVAFYVDPIQTGFLMMFQKSYGGTEIMIPVKKAPQEWKKQKSGGFLQE
jgi:hypothetical protein